MSIYFDPVEGYFGQGNILVLPVEDTLKFYNSKVNRKIGTYAEKIGELLEEDGIDLKNKADITFYFACVESIDIIIDRLYEVRRYVKDNQIKEEEIK